MLLQETLTPKTIGDEVKVLSKFGLTKDETKDIFHDMKDSLEVPPMPLPLIA